MLPFYSLEKFLPFPKGLHTRSLCSPLLQTFLSQPPQAGCMACVGAISISQCQAATHNTSCFISAPTPPTLLGKKPPTTSWCDGRGDRWGGGELTGPLPAGWHPVLSVTRFQARDRALGAACHVRSVKASLLSPAAGTSIVLTWRVPYK